MADTKDAVLEKYELVKNLTMKDILLDDPDHIEELRKESPFTKKQEACASLIIHHILCGIIRGMSGSPIVQNGKLVGAVPHVLVNDLTRGYGILIENMLEH